MNLNRNIDGRVVPVALAEAAEEEVRWREAEVEAQKIAVNAPILARLAVLDVKRIRPLAEGDQAYLATINAQILALRGQLVK